MAYKENKTQNTSSKKTTTPRFHKVVKGEKRPAQRISNKNRILESYSKSLSDLRAAGRANGSEFAKANKDEYKHLKERVQDTKKQLRKTKRDVKKELKKK